MSLPLEPGELARVAEAARIADERALDHPAKLAAYLDRHWQARSHSDLISRSLVDLATGDCKRLLVTTPPQIGKMCSDDTPVPTPTGWKRHGDLRAGDEVMHPSGKPTRVVAVHEPDMASMVVRTRSGAEITVHPRHEWTVYDRHQREWVTLETQELLHGRRPGRGRGWSRNTNTWGTRTIKLRTGGEGRGGRWRFQLPWQEALDLPPADLPVDPYTLGVWLGDGTTTCGAITHDPGDVYELPYPVTSVKRHPTTGVLTTYYSGLFTELLSLGVASRETGVRSKHIPDIYLRASDEQRWDLLCGLVDSDGTITAEGQVTISGSDQRLMYDVAELVRTFGYRPTVRAMPPATSSSGIVGTKWVYVVQFTPHDGRYPARFKRKLDSIRGDTSRVRGNVLRRRDAIVSVEHCEPRPGRCITVAADDGMYLVGEHMIPTHNSSLVSEWFPFWWLINNPAHRVIVGSYGTSLANRRGRVVRKMIREHGWRYGLQLEHGAAGVAEWTLDTGGGLKSVGVGSAVTGSPADCVAGGTLITTEHGEIPAARLARMTNPPRVAGWDHPRARFGWFPLVAVRAIRVHQLRELTTEGGRSLWCTPNHPVFVIGRGYVPANTVKPGEEVITGAEPRKPMGERPFPMGGSSNAVGQSTRTAQHPAGTPLPERRRDWIARNRMLRTGRTHTVYDFQVSHANNFLADGILAHNCAIVDDPHKNRAEAESLVTRDKVWDWWSADITSRLAPGAPIVLVMTLWHCLAYDQTVSTTHGSTPVQNIEAGDYVLTSNGYQQVQATSSRLHTGNSVRIRVYGTPEELHVTPDHRVWTETGWHEAGTLNHGDWLMLPAPPREQEMTTNELRTLVPEAETTSRTPATRGTGEHAPLTKEQFEQHLDDGLTYRQIANLYGRKSKQAAFQWARTIGVRDRTRGNALDTTCALDPEFWRVIGLWIAEGIITYGSKGYNANVCRWSFGAHEEHTHAADVVKLLDKYGITAKCNIRGSGTRTAFHKEYEHVEGTAVVSLSSRQLASLLGEFGTGAHEKHLPDWAFRLPREHAFALLRGWAEGDGCPMTASNGFTQVTSASFRLLRDFQQLLIRHGRKANITGSNGKSHPQLRFKLDGNDGGNRIRTDERGMWVRVRQIDHEQYDGPVYDLQTPTGDFVAGGVLVHNCDDLAGRVLAQDGTEEEGGLWRVVRMPAFADSATDPIGRVWGQPLPHPKVPEGDDDALRQHWQLKRNTSLVRDWHALYQCDPKPNEGALVSPELLRARRHFPPPADIERQRYGVAVDPAAGGRDLAGVIGGYLATDGRLYLDRDTSRNGHSEQWAMEAALMAAEEHADFVIFEKSGLFDHAAARTAFDSAWSAVDRMRRGDTGEFDEPDHARRAQLLDAMPHHPQIKMVAAKKGKLLRAEPIAQQFTDDRLRFATYLPEVESEWQSWQVTDPNSPGRIDASCYLAYEMLPIPGSEALVSTASSLSRQQIQWESTRRQHNGSTGNPAVPQVGHRIERRPMRPGMPGPGRIGHQ